MFYVITFPRGKHTLTHLPGHTAAQADFSIMLPCYRLLRIRWTIGACIARYELEHNCRRELVMRLPPTLHRLKHVDGIPATGGFQRRRRRQRWRGMNPPEVRKRRVYIVVMGRGGRGHDKMIMLGRIGNGSRDQNAKSRTLLQKHDASKPSIFEIPKKDRGHTAFEVPSYSPCDHRLWHNSLSYEKRGLHESNN